MEIFVENLDLILTAAVILIAAVVFARQGQISLLRELILSLSGTDSSDLYQKLPAITRLLVSDKTVTKMCRDSITNSDLL